MTYFKSLALKVHISDIIQQYLTFFENSTIFDIIRQYSTIFDIIQRNATFFDRRIMLKNVAVHNFYCRIMSQMSKNVAVHSGGDLLKKLCWNHG